MYNRYKNIGNYDEVYNEKLLWKLDIKSLD